MRWLSVLLVAGCIDDPETDGTKMHVDGHATGTSVRICAEPRDLLSCNGSEAFVVRFGSEVAEPGPGLFSFGAQSSQFETNDADTPVTITRTRDGATASVTLPPPFTLVGPSGEGVRRSESFELTWEPGTGDDRLVMRLSTTCDGATYSQHDITIDDDGSQIIAAKGFPEGDPDAPGGCRGGVELARIRQGTVAGFGGDSSIEATQTRSLGFRLAE